MYEIAPSIENTALTYGVRIRNNYVINSKQQGIYISASCNTLVEHNTILHAWVGIVLHGMPRKQYLLQDNIVRKNLIGYSDRVDVVLYEGERAANNSIDENFYLDPSGGSKLSFGLRKDKAYKSDFSRLEALRKESGFEQKGKAGAIKWGYPEILDVNIPKNSPAREFGVIQE